VTTRQDLDIRQGQTWSYVYTKLDDAGEPVDLTGYTARAALRQFIGWALEVYLSTGSDAQGGSIVLGGADGTVTLAMTAEQSAALISTLGAVTADLWRERAQGGVLGGGVDSLWGQMGVRRTVRSTVQLLYDLELVSPSGEVTRELEGHATVHREVTT
jgi:hypothetical protein